MEISVQELRRQLSDVLAVVAAGEEVLITQQGRPVARLVPPEQPLRRLPSMAALRRSVRRRGRPLSEDVVVERGAERR